MYGDGLMNGFRVRIVDGKLFVLGNTNTVVISTKILKLSGSLYRNKFLRKKVEGRKNYNAND